MEPIYTEQDCRNFFRLTRSLCQHQVPHEILRNIQKQYYQLEHCEFGNVIKYLRRIPSTQFPRIAEALSTGQIESKLWLVDILKSILPRDPKAPYSALLAGGWFGILNLLLKWRLGSTFQNVRSFDLDPDANHIAETINRQYVNDRWMFKAIDQDIFEFDFRASKISIPIEGESPVDILLTPDVIINTSCEHMENLRSWINLLPKGKLVVLQSNDFFSLNDHVNCVKSVEELADQANFSSIFFSGTKELELYNRFMVMGTR